MAHGDTHVRSAARPIGLVDVHMRPARNGALKEFLMQRNL